jgi:hypothetical protein
VNNRTFEAAAMAVLVAAALAPAPARAQAVADPTAGYIVIVEPREWTGVGTRGIVRWRRPVRVTGLAFHASGVRAVTLNGALAALSDDRSGATRFVGTVGADAASRGVEIVAYPNAGPAVVRHQRADGTSVTERRAQQPPPPVTAGAAEASALRVELGPLPQGGREAVTRSLQGDRGIVSVPSVADPHLRVRAEGGHYLVAGRDGSVRHRVAAPSPSVGADGLREALAQEFGALQLEELAPPARSFPLEFAFGSRGEFRLGDGIEFRVRPARAGYLTVIDLGTNGALSVLYPLDAAAVFVGAQQEVRLPTTADRERVAPNPPYQAGEPTGAGAVRAFVTPRPLQLGAGDDPLTADAVLRALQAASAGGEPWATAMLRYRITP